MIWSIYSVDWSKPNDDRLTLLGNIKAYTGEEALRIGILRYNVLALAYQNRIVARPKATKYSVWKSKKIVEGVPNPPPPPSTYTPYVPPKTRWPFYPKTPKHLVKRNHQIAAAYAVEQTTFEQLAKDFKLSRDMVRNITWREYDRMLQKSEFQSRDCTPEEVYWETEICRLTPVCDRSERRGDDISLTLLRLAYNTSRRQSRD